MLVSEISKDEYKTQIEQINTYPLRNHVLDWMLSARGNGTEKYYVLKDSNDKILASAFTQSMGGYVWICFLQTVLGRGKLRGMGAVLLSNLIKINGGKNIALKVRDNLPELQLYYSKFGFKKVSKDMFGEDNVMVTDKLRNRTNENSTKRIQE